MPTAQKPGSRKTTMKAWRLNRDYRPSPPVRGEESRERGGARLLGSSRRSGHGDPSDGHAAAKEGPSKRGDRQRASRLRGRLCRQKRKAGDGVITKEKPPLARGRLFERKVLLCLLLKHDTA